MDAKVSSVKDEINNLDLTKQNNLSNRMYNKSDSMKHVATVLLSLGSDIGANILKHFSNDEIKMITFEMSKLSDIKLKDAHDSISLFFDVFRQHSGIHGGNKKLISHLLENTFDGNLAKDLVADIYGDEIRDKAQYLTWIPAENLAEEIKKEHLQMQALLIAHLPSEYSAKVLEFFELPIKNKIILEISKTQVINDLLAENLMNLIESLKNLYRKNNNSALKGHKIVANILNHLSSDRAEFLKYLKENDTDSATEIEKEMFTFEVLFKQKMQVLERINDDVDIEQWAIALKGYTDEEKAIIIDTYPMRQAQELKERMVQLGPTVVSRVERMRKEILETVKFLEQKSEIELSLFEEHMLE